MKPRYAIVDENAREKFEREWQLPYGYGNCVVSCDFDVVKRTYNKLHAGLAGYIIEKYENGIRETIYPEKV